MFAELMKVIYEKMETYQYTEALCMYNIEQQNFQKLMTDVIYTNEDNVIHTQGFCVLVSFHFLIDDLHQLSKHLTVSGSDFCK
jgi:hypothetical protein